MKKYNKYPDSKIIDSLMVESIEVGKKKLKYGKGTEADIFFNFLLLQVRSGNCYQPEEKYHFLYFSLQQFCKKHGLNYRNAKQQVNRMGLYKTIVKSEKYTNDGRSRLCWGIDDIYAILGMEEIKETNNEKGENNEK